MKKRLPSHLFLAAVAWALLPCAAPAQVTASRPPPNQDRIDSQRVYETQVKPFLAAHCLQCHNGDDAQANFRIDNLATDFLLGKTGDNWKEIYDNISLGRMPKKKRLVGAEIDDANAVTDWIDQEIRHAERRAKNSSDRNPMRRLNRSEYLNSLRDLFALDDEFLQSIAEDLQPDGTFAGFDRVGTSLYLDSALLHRYYEVADKVLDRHVFRSNPNTRKVRDYARDITWPQGMSQQVTKVTSWPRVLKDYVDLRSEPVFLPTGATAYELKNGGIEYLVRLGHIGDHFGSSGSGAGGGLWGRNVLNVLFGVKESGLYRFKIRAGGFKGTGKYALDDVKLIYEYVKDPTNPDRATVVIDAPLDQPKEYEFTLYIHHIDRPNGLMNRFTWNGIPTDGDVIYSQATETHVIQEAPELAKAQIDFLTVWNRLQGQRDAARAAGNQMRVAELAEEIKQTAEKGAKDVHEFILGYKGPAYVYNPKIDLQAIPRLWLEYLEVEGPLVEWPPRGRKAMFFDGEQRAIDKAYIQEIFARFLPRAYRRPVEPAEIEAVVSFVLQTQERGQLAGADAVKKGVRAVLCSPGFLLIQEPADDSGRPRKLNDYELASRLSYYLWSSMPDEELFQLAANNKLHDPATLQAQVRRLIADPKATQFVRNFAGQWLKIRDFDNTKTDQTQYKSYNHELRKSSWQEPYEFFNEVLRGDLSVLNFVDSDFLVIDERLAKHYGIEGVQGEQFRKVAIRPEQHRGGILGMAGVLTFLTDGLRTLPVRRAAYVLDTLWNDPPKPPPPGAGDLPVVSGKNLTVRQRLQQHRDSMMCASCHARIDPFGMALENYDAIGSWRERQNGDGLRGDDQSPPLDVSGELPNSGRNTPGRKFSNLVEYKKALLAEKDHFVHGFTEKMLTYALCRPISRTADRAIIEQVVQKLEHDQYRMQSLVQAIVASEAFGTK